MTDTNTQLTERDEVEMLLPWFAMDKLDASDRARVQHWLARDEALVRQLALIEDDRRATIRSNEAARLPSTLSVPATLARLTPKASGTTAVAQGLFEKFRGFWAAPTSQGLKWATAAAAVLFLAQTAWLGTLITKNAPSQYQTASGSSGQVLDGTFALVRFTDTASMQDVSAALSALQMTIVDGPKTGSLFRVRLGEANMSASTRDEHLQLLRKQSGIVVLATPAAKR